MQVLITDPLLPGFCKIVSIDTNLHDYHTIRTLLIIYVRGLLAIIKIIIRRLFRKLEQMRRSVLFIRIT